MDVLSKELVFEKAHSAFGVVPGVVKELAQRSVATAYFYTAGVEIMRCSSFTELEVNAIELKISALNNCASCIKGHSFLANKAGLSDADVSAILDNLPLSDKHLDQLVRAAEYIYYAGADKFPDMVIEFFDDEGITHQQVIDIIALIALKTISNYTNNFLVSLKQKGNK